MSSIFVWQAADWIIASMDTATDRVSKDWLMHLFTPVPSIAFKRAELGDHVVAALFRLYSKTVTVQHNEGMC